MDKKLLSLVFSDYDSKKQVNETVKTIVTNLDPDLRIISAENEEIQANKYILSLFSPSLSPLLSSSCCSPTTIFLPDFSTSSIKDIINIISSGFVLSDYLSLEDELEITEIGKILFIK